MHSLCMTGVFHKALWLKLTNWSHKNGRERKEKQKKKTLQAERGWIKQEVGYFQNLAYSYWFTVTLAKRPSITEAQVEKSHKVSRLTQMSVTQ